MKHLLFILCLVAASLPARAEEFHGYPCTKDCSGHKAGYAWAQNHGITDPLECRGKSQSFVEGCISWAEEQQAEESTDTNSEELAE